MQVYGRGGSKGPILLIADMGDQFAFIDLSRAGRKDIQDVMGGWYQMILSDGLRNRRVESRGLFDIIKGLVCNTAKQMVTVYAPGGGDPTRPETYGYADGRWSRPSIFSIGAILFGGPFTQAACSL